MNLSFGKTEVQIFSGQADKVREEVSEFLEENPDILVIAMTQSESFIPNDEFESVTSGEVKMTLTLIFRVYPTEKGGVSGEAAADNMV